MKLNIKRKREINGRFSKRKGDFNNYDWLYKKYVIERLSWKDFYNIHNMSPAFLQRKLKYFNIKRKRISWNIGLTKETDKRINYERTTQFKKGHDKGCRFGRDKDCSGKNHPQWKGGITSLVMKIRNSKKMKEWRIKVFNRDNYICQECGKKGGKLQAHHVKSFSEYPEYRFGINNGLTLCIECHKKTNSYLKFKKKINYHGSAGIGFA